MPAVQNTLKPKSGVTLRIWEIADDLTRRSGRQAVRADVLEQAGREGIHPGTASKQYNDWRLSYEREAGSLPSGVSETAAAPFAVALQIGMDGRILIPVELRRQMKIDDSGRLTASVVDGELRLISPNAALEQFHRYIRDQGLTGGSIVDELIADRRVEAERE